MQNLEHQLLLQRKTARTFFWHRVRWDVIYRHLRDHNVQSLVDVGAGSGIFADFVKRKLPKTEYFFVEPSKALSTLLGQEFGEKQDLTHANNYHRVDAVMLLDVLEHIEEDQKFLIDLISKMKPGAVLAITVPAMKSLWSGWDPLVGHHRRYGKKDLSKLFQTFGKDFEVEEFRYIFWELIPLAIHRKWKLRDSVFAQVDPLKESEVPHLSPLVNGMLYFISSIGLTISRWMPFGTTLVLVGKKKSA
jgi:SAM-dependent methyltransferase